MPVLKLDAEEITNEAVERYNKLKNEKKNFMIGKFKFSWEDYYAPPALMIDGPLFEYESTNLNSRVQNQEQVLRAIAVEKEDIVVCLKVHGEEFELSLKGKDFKEI